MCAESGDVQILKLHGTYTYVYVCIIYHTLASLASYPGSSPTGRSLGTRLLITKIEQFCLYVEIRSTVMTKLSQAIPVESHHSKTLHIHMYAAYVCTMYQRSLSCVQHMYVCVNKMGRGYIFLMNSTCTSVSSTSHPQCRTQLTVTVVTIM